MMLGTEGKLGPWRMPEKEPDMQQKTRDNLQSLAHSTEFIQVTRAFNENIKEMFPKKALVFTNKEGVKFVANRQAERVWEGFGGGALSELKADGLLKDAIELVRSITRGEEDEGD